MISKLPRWAWFGAISHAWFGNRVLYFPAAVIGSAGVVYAAIDTIAVSTR